MNHSNDIRRERHRLGARPAGAPATRLAVVAALTSLVVVACGGGSSGNGNGGGAAATPPPPPVNAAPQAAGLKDQRVDQDMPLSVAFSVSDAESAASALTVSVDSSNKALVPADGAVLSGNAESRTLRLAPLEDATGQSTIAVTVRDPNGATSTASFVLTVAAVRASLLNATGTAFTRTAGEAAVSVNGRTYDQDADDASFGNLLATGSLSGG